MPGLLEHPPSRIIMELLVANGYGVDPDETDDRWPVYVDVLSNEPDDIIRVADTTGSNHGNTMDGEKQGDDGIQITVRAAAYEDAFRKINEIAIFLDQIFREVVDVLAVGTGSSSASTRYLVQAVTRTSSVISLGMDAPQGKRRLFSTNALCTIRSCPC